MRKNCTKQPGYSLIELLLSIGLGILMTTIMLQVFSSNKAISRSQEGLAQIQQNGRFADFFLARDIRMVGYQGCSSQDNIQAANLLNPPIPSTDLDKINAIAGFNAQGGNWSPALHASLSGAGVLPETDAFIVRFASSQAAPLSASMATKSDNINVENKIAFAENDYLVIDDCQNVDIFQATSGTSSTSVSHSAGPNLINELTKAFAVPSQVAKFESFGYYIADTGRTNLAGAAINALFRMDIDGNASELVEGVEDMQVLYGLDTNSDNTVDIFTTADLISTDPTANNSWANVLSVRISLLLNSIENVTESPQAYTFNGTTVNDPGDRLARKQWDVYVTLRNRLQ